MSTSRPRRMSCSGSTTEPAPASPRGQSSILRQDFPFRKYIMLRYTSKRIHENSYIGIASHFRCSVFPCRELAYRGRLQAGRCFSTRRLVVGSSCSGCAFGGFPGRSGRDHILATAYMTIENVVFSLLLADRRRKQYVFFFFAVKRTTTPLGNA